MPLRAMQADSFGQDNQIESGGAEDVAAIPSESDSPGSSDQDTDAEEQAELRKISMVPSLEGISLVFEDCKPNILGGQENATEAFLFGLAAMFGTVQLENWWRIDTDETEGSVAGSTVGGTKLPSFGRATVPMLHYQGHDCKSEKWTRLYKNLNHSLNGSLSSFFKGIGQGTESQMLNFRKRLCAYIVGLYDIHEASDPEKVWDHLGKNIVSAGQQAMKERPVLRKRLRLPYSHEYKCYVILGPDNEEYNRCMDVAQMENLQMSRFLRDETGGKSSSDEENDTASVKGKGSKKKPRKQKKSSRLNSSFAAESVASAAAVARKKRDGRRFGTYDDQIQQVLDDIAFQKDAIDDLLSSISEKKGMIEDHEQQILNYEKEMQDLKGKKKDEHNGKLVMEAIKNAIALEPTAVGLLDSEDKAKATFEAFGLMGRAIVKVVAKGTPKENMMEEILKEMMSTDGKQPRATSTAKRSANGKEKDNITRKRLRPDNEDDNVADLLRIPGNSADGGENNKGSAPVGDSSMENETGNTSVDLLANAMVSSGLNLSAEMNYADYALDNVSQDESNADGDDNTGV